MKQSISHERARQTGRKAFQRRRIGLRKRWIYIYVYSIMQFDASILTNFEVIDFFVDDTQYYSSYYKDGKSQKL